MTTPFSNWRETGKPDPVANALNEARHLRTVDIVDGLLYNGAVGPAKDRLRVLSRKLYDIAPPHDIERINKKRSAGPLGEYTDDELANMVVFDYRESVREAAAHRIAWLWAELTDAIILT